MPTKEDRMGVFLLVIMRIAHECLAHLWLSIEEYVCVDVSGKERLLKFDEYLFDLCFDRDEYFVRRWEEIECV